MTKHPWRRRAPIGPADLLRATTEVVDPAHVAQIANALGMRATSRSTDVQQLRERPVEDEPPTVPREPPKPALKRPDPQPSLLELKRRVEAWRLSTIEYFQSHDHAHDHAHEVPKRAVARLRASDIAWSNDAPRPRFVPLAPWPKLRRVMERRLRALQPSRQVDEEELVRRLAQGAPVTRIPRRSQVLARRKIVVLRDDNPSLVPFWADQQAVAHRIHREFGVPVTWFRPWRGLPPRVGPDQQRVHAIVGPVAPGDVVLALSDLGHYDGGGAMAAWVDWGRALQRRGVEPVALMMCPRARWHADAVAVWSMIDWADPQRGMATRSRSCKAKTPGGQLLAALVSWVVLLEPALLRAIRAAVPCPDLDFGAEADLWRLRGEGSSPVALQLPLAEVREGQQRLVSLLADPGWHPRIRRVVEVVRHWHAPLPRQLWLEEARTMWLLGDPAGAITAAERDAIALYTQKVRDHIVENTPLDPSLGDETDIRWWTARLMGRQPGSAWEHGRLGRWMLEVSVALEPDLGALPAGVQAKHLVDIDVGAPRPTRALELRQRGALLELRGSGSGVGSPLGELPVKRWVQWGDGRPRSLESTPIGFALPQEQRRVVLQTDQAKATFERVSLMGELDWASGMGRDRYGLWASFVVKKNIEVKKDIEVRLRWIPPGRFMMGSPESEPGRTETEVQHQVTLTQGFWMAETPTTQSLWQAVTGKNHSQFKSPDRPVESVSYRQVEAFLATLNEELPGPPARLPTEAEWEYACRAGTTEATYAGPMDIRGVGDAPVLDDVAWYAGNSGVDFDLEGGERGTHPVARKRPNPWGLYDMLGNVWEWCRDASDFPLKPYSPAAVRDPEGRSGPARVLRGGGWYYPAAYVRAASRDADHPDYAFGHLGFRLVRGQELRQAGEQA